MKKSPALLSLLSSLLLITACDPYPPTPNLDYSIRVTPTAQGMNAQPPACPSWATASADPYDEQPLPQFGCAQQRNLSAMIENPDDLVQGRPFGNARGVTAVGAVRRYDNNQPRGLIWTGSEDNAIAVTTSPASASSMSGDVTGATPSTSAPAAAAAGP